MATFPLADLDRTLVEKVITKLDEKSYFRLRQTCRYVDEVIRKSKTISVQLEGSYTPVWNKCACMYYSSKYNEEIAVGALYGTRWSSFHSPQKSVRFSKLCDYLKEARITCVELLSFHSQWSLEQCGTLLKILKPVKVEMKSEGSNRFEALFQTKTLKSVKVILDYDVVSTVAPRLLSAFQEVKIFVFATSDKFLLLRKVLHLIRSQPFPNFRKFRLGVSDPGFSQAKLEEQLQELNLTARTEKVLLPGGCYCKISIESREYIDVEIYYGVHLFV